MGKQSQRLDTLLGSIIRIDIRGATDEQPYKVPSDNPLVSVPDARPEIWAWGLRNPWRMDIDPESGNIWVEMLAGLASRRLPSSKPAQITVGTSLKAEKAVRAARLASPKKTVKTRQTKWCSQSTNTCTRATGAR